MPTSKPSATAAGSRQAAESPSARERAASPWCPCCRSADYLVFDAVRTRLDAAGLRKATWDLDYWCAGCDRYFGHECSELPRAAARLPAEVLYVHCGQAMSPTAVEPRAIGAGGAGPALPAVVMFAHVWQCRCGFQLAVPELGS